MGFSSLESLALEFAVLGRRFGRLCRVLSSLYQHLSLPLLGFLVDRFRARKLVFAVLTAVLFVTALAPLMPLVVSLPTCFVTQSGSAMNQTSHQSKEYLQSTIKMLGEMSKFPGRSQNTSGGVKMTGEVLFNRSSSPTILPSHGKSHSQIPPTLAGVKMRRNTVVPWLSTLFVFISITKLLVSVLERALLSLLNLATTTHLKENRASFGCYFMWCHMGASLFLFAVGLLASHFKLSICGVIGDGYYITFVWASAAIFLSSFAVPWFKYEYLEHRVISWTEVKCVFSDIHYVFLLILGLFLGGCFAFQFYWEFWFISELSGSPTIMGLAGLIRRPLVGVWFYLSGHLIEKVGDLKTIAVALFLFSVSFLAISFINVPWLVLVVDLLQAGAYAFSYTGLTIHFSKPGSKASSTVILGKIFQSAYTLKG